MIDEQPPTRVPDPILPKVRRSAFTRVFGSLFAILFVVGALLAVLGSWAWLTFTAPGPLKAKKIYEITKDLDRTQIAVALQDQGIIADARIFSAAAAVNGFRGGRLRAGEFEFPAGVTMEEALSIITAGRFLTYKVTVPEGWTSQMVVARLNEQKELEGDVKAIPPEGSILPDTYVFRRGLTRQKLIDDMQAAQTKLLDVLWQGRPSTTKLKTPQELVTMASIVEKETGIDEERPKVASVFLNRLDQNMRLQSDPTIIYGIVGGKGKLDRPLTKADIETSTPYNTYTISGLPPGPIANPGKAALQAVLNPDATKYLFFVADGSGGHAFASTLEEHNLNVKKWRALQTTTEGAAPATTEPDNAVKPDAAKAAGAEVPQPVPQPEDAAVPADPTIPQTETDAVPPEPAAATIATKPGSTVKVNGKQVPIPIPKKPKK